MKTIRYGSFETNSSSTHAIVIPKRVKEEDWAMEDSLDHKYDFGREECRLVNHWDEKLAYTYMILKYFEGWTDNNRKTKVTKETIIDFKKKVNKIYKEVEQIVKYKPYDRDPKPDDIFKYIDNHSWERPYPYVDHCEDFDTNGFLDRILNDDEYLKKFLFNNGSYITVGGDEYRGYNIKTIGFEYDYDNNYINTGTEECPNYEDVSEFWDKLKEYEKDNDVYLKGN